jgi:hypothetical protein
MKKIIVLIFAAYVSTIAALAQNLIQNGNFATGDFTGWTVGGSYFSVQASSYGINPPSGDSYMAVADGNETLSQTFATTIGQNYALSLDNANSRGPNNQGGVYFRGSINGTTLFTDTADLSNTSWLTSTYNFTAASASTTMQLTLNFFNANGDGLFDDISVTPVPEPSTLAVYALGIFASFLMFRRKGVSSY